MAAKPPSEIAREALRQLSARRLPPTPDHYQTLYEEISGEASAPAFPTVRLRQILRVMPGQTPAQRRLLEQLEGAIDRHDWGALQSVLVGYATLGLAPVASADASAAPRELPRPLSEPLARLVENTLPALGSDDARVLEMAAQLVQLLRQDDAPAADAAGQLINNFAYRLSFASEDQAQIRTGLFALLHMVFENIAALSLGDAWLQHQAQALRDAATPPLTLRRLDDVQRRLKDVIFKQGEARERTLAAQAQMKELLATFIDRLAQVDESSDAYHQKLERCAARITEAASLAEITPLLEEVMGATRSMTLSSRLVRSELHDLRERAEATQLQIDSLRQELDRASALARHDPLTGALNRKGLSEAMEREVARSRRNDAPLCVALLDLDNFKALNDRLGHASGDAALQHLTAVVRDVIRPQDQVARYGGEEFVLLLPDTPLEQGLQAMRRLQRELTKRYFLQNDERVLITFSAGVVQMSGEESSEDSIVRADKAMYLAKRSGKNRVLAG